MSKSLDSLFDACCAERDSLRTALEQMRARMEEADRQHEYWFKETALQRGLTDATATERDAALARAEAAEAGERDAVEVAFASKVHHRQLAAARDALRKVQQSNRHLQSDWADEHDQCPEYCPRCIIDAALAQFEPRGGE